MEVARSPESVADAYSSGGAAWATGPSRVYARLAEVLVASAPVSLAGRLVCDVGAGTGVASRAAVAAGARVVATDIAPGMVAVDRDVRPPAVVADAIRLPFRDGALGGVVAAYCYNHLPDPVAGLREARRVTEPGGVVLASAYALDDAHPVKEAVETALAENGWTSPPFYADLKRDSVPQLATVERAGAAARAAGLHEVAACALRVPFPELSVDDLIEWRLGMSHTSWYVEGFEHAARASLVTRARALLGPDVPVLERSVIHIAGLA